MKIAVTGASGFIGRSVVEQLNKLDSEVIPVTRSCTDYSAASLSQVLRGADKVIHLAAVRGGDGSMADYHDNERITENLLTAMAEGSADRIILASSRMVYSGEDKIPWKETDIPAPNSLYGISKLECENLCSYLSRKYGFGCTAIRIAQVMGTGDKVRNMMNVFLDRASKGEPLKVIGKSRARRQYIYVKDLVEVLAILALGNEHYSADSNTIVNVGMPEAYSNLEVAQIVNEVYGNPTPIDYDDSYPEKGRPFRMDISRLKDELGYEPLDMREAVTAFKEHKE